MRFSKELNITWDSFASSVIDIWHGTLSILASRFGSCPSVIPKLFKKRLLLWYYEAIRTTSETLPDLTNVSV